MKRKKHYGRSRRIRNRRINRRRGGKRHINSRRLEFYRTARGGIRL